MPRLFVDAYGALPLRVAAGRVLYLGFEESLDPVLALAVERMTGLRVESGIVQGSLFRPRMPGCSRQISLRGTGRGRLRSGAGHALARSIERSRPVASRLVRVHDCLWLRMWTSAADRHPLPEAGSVVDLVCSIGRI